MFRDRSELKNVGAVGGAANASNSQHATECPVARAVGRRRDPGRDLAIVTATLELLAEVGYETMTIDAVAARAKAGKATLYRRWESKAELVVDAVSSLGADIDPKELPDTGSLEGDLDAARNLKQQNTRIIHSLTVLRGLVPVLAGHPELLAIVKENIIEPGRRMVASLLDRAIARGEISPDTDVATLSLVLPAMMTFQVTVLHEDSDMDFATRAIRSVILPAARNSKH